jgi:Arc/MetJ-type ribon-helix-helix transcriptional regulator
MKIERIRVMIEWALADGRLSRSESEVIRAAIYESEQFSPEKARLLRELHEKIWQGEIQLDELD